MTPANPSHPSVEAAREARQAVREAKMVCAQAYGSEEPNDFALASLAHDRALSGYATAVRAQAIAECRACVEGAENTDNPWRDSSVDIGRDSHDDGFESACSTILARLATLAEGTP